VDDSGVGGRDLSNVIDLYTGTTNITGGVMSGVAGAKIQLIKDVGTLLITNLVTTTQGVAEFEDLPAGSYKVKVTAPKHKDYVGRVWIKPGLIAQQTVWLDCQLVTVEWSVVPTTIEDKYEIVLHTTYETHVPAAVVLFDPAVVLLPEMKVGDVYNGEMRLINRGLLEAKTVQFTPRQGSGRLLYELLADVPAAVMPNEIVFSRIGHPCRGLDSGNHGLAEPAPVQTPPHTTTKTCAYGQRSIGGFTKWGRAGRREWGGGGSGEYSNLAITAAANLCAAPENSVTAHPHARTRAMTRLIPIVAVCKDRRT
jgi:hypothetical protein